MAKNADADRFLAVYLNDFDFHDLAARADNQGQRLEDPHLAATQRALP